MRSERPHLKAIFLAILMVMMVQTGYMDIWNVNQQILLSETTPKESGATEIRLSQVRWD